MNNSLDVYWAEKKAGRLWLAANRAFIFQYDPEWATSPESLPISLRLPLKPEVFEDDAAKPFFTNLLPEAHIREMIAKSLGVSERNDFKLLEELGGDCAGALSLLPEGRTPAKDGKYEPLSGEELDRMIDAMPQRPLLAAKDGLRLSLAGAQHKLPVYVNNKGAFFLPSGAFATTHILKPAIPRFKDTVENEAFCMQLAEACGLPVPKVEVREGKNRALLVQRYDRTFVAGAPVRLHQEDFCQALGYSYEQKYEAEHGPGLKQCFALIEEHSSQPILDKRHILRWVVFNYLIGNCDAHAKNISILITRDGFRLAPFYDLMSTTIYPELDQKFAMKIGGENRHDWVMKRHWERLAEEAGVGTKAVLGICNDLEEALPAALEKREKEFVAKHGAKETIHEIEQLATARAKLLRERLAEKSPQNPPEPVDDSAERYAPEIRAADDFLFQSVGSKFTHYGGWELLAYPIGYKAERIADPRDVKRLVIGSEVELRGWNLPHTDKEHASYFLSGFQSLTQWERYIEGYRANQSGLFVWKRLFFEDIEGRKDSKGRRVLEYVNLMWEMTEIFLFLKQYYGKVPDTEKVHFRFALNGTANRSLMSLEPGIHFPDGHVSQEPSIIFQEDIRNDELQKSYEALANRFIMRTLLIFGVEDISSGTVSQWQQKLLTRKF